MKTIAIMIACIINLTVHAQETSLLKTGPQGGGMKTIQNYNIELVNSTNRISVYLYDKSLSPVSNDGVLGEVIFCYTYNECLNKPLTTLGKNGFTVSVANTHYDYCDITLIINGIPVEAKFNNSTGFAENK